MKKYMKSIVIMIGLVLALSSCNPSSPSISTVPPKEVQDTITNTIIAVNEFLDDASKTEPVENPDGTKTYTVSSFTGSNGITISGEITVDADNNIVSINLPNTDTGQPFEMVVGNDGTVSVTIGDESCEVNDSLIPRNPTDDESNLLEIIYYHVVSKPSSFAIERITAAIKEAVKNQQVNDGVYDVEDYTYQDTTITGTISVPEDETITACDIRYEITGSNNDGSTYTIKGVLKGTLTEEGLVPNELTLEIENYYAQTEDNQVVLIESSRYIMSGSMQEVEASINLKGPHTFYFSMNLQDRTYKQVLDGQNLIADWFGFDENPPVEVEPDNPIEMRSLP